jgi:hypothetical protein
MKFLVSFLAVFFTLGCSHLPGKLSSRPAQKLRLVPKIGEKERTRYVSHSISDTYQNGELQQKKREDVEFVVEATVANVDSVNKRIAMDVTTVEQDGAAQLRDFAMPALNEKIRMVIDDRMQVFAAGRYERSSIFFVPQLSLPEKPVKAGDTWEMIAEWSTFQGVPLRMEIVSVLKDFVTCGRFTCADIEVSGDVEILGASDDLRFRSELSGRYLFVVDRGIVLWALVRSDQEIATTADRVQVTNCLLSRLEAPAEYVWSEVVANDCTPEQKIPEKLSSALKLNVSK